MLRKDGGEERKSQRGSTEANVCDAFAPRASLRPSERAAAAKGGKPSADRRNLSFSTHPSTPPSSPTAPSSTGPRACGRPWS
jgi:hypothetical protein